MSIVDRALEQRASDGNPIRVGILGAGFLGRGLARQINCSVRGMRAAVICNRRAEAARQVFIDAGIQDVQLVDSPGALDRLISLGGHAVCEDPRVLCQASSVDALVDCTGTIEYSARIAVDALDNGKHFISNAELDSTLGPILKLKADKAGVVFTSIDGDQPGTEMNLYRFVRRVGLTPLLCGNIKGLQDHYRTPDTQREFAKRYGLSTRMATQFADGSKISFEQASVANATAMRVAKRGMLGYAHDGHVDDLTRVFRLEQLQEWGGIVDYVLGAKPSPGVFILAACEHSWHRPFLDLAKMGDGPLYCFYTPHHLAHLEAPSAVAKAVLFHDAVVAPIGPPSVEVITTAKCDLRANDMLDGIGQFMSYGECENADTAREQNLLPLGLSEGCRLVRDIRKDQTLTFDDVIVPEGRTCDHLWAEQRVQFGLPEPCAVR